MANTDIHDILEESQLEEQKDGFSLKKQIDDKATEVLTALSGRGSNALKKVLNNVIAFMSPSGGTGSSTLVASIAYNMKKMGLSVIVVDLNILFPSQHIYFEVKQELKKKDLVSYLTGQNTLGDSIEYHNGVGTLTSNNRSITDYINCDNESASEAITEALDRLSYLFDVVLIDSPRELTYDIVGTALYKVDNIYFVLDDGVQSLINIAKVKNNFEVIGVHTSKIKYVMNKRTSIYYPKSNLDSMKITLEDIIPFEIGVLESGLRGEIFLKGGESTSKTSKEYVNALQRFTRRVLEIGGRETSKI